METMSVSRFGLKMRGKLDLPLRITRHGKTLFYVTKERPLPSEPQKPKETLEVKDQITSSVESSVEKTSSFSSYKCNWSSDCQEKVVGKFELTFIDNMEKSQVKQMYLCFSHSQLKLSGVDIKRIE